MKDHQAIPLGAAPLLFLLVSVPAGGGEARAASVLHFVGWKSEAPRVWDEAIAEFERRNGVRVVREVGPSSSTQFHDLLAQKLKNRDRSLDVFLMDVIWPAEFASAGWALPLDRFFDRAAQDEFLEAPLEAGRYGGRIYGVPLFIDAGVLYYRADLLAKYRLEPPRTWTHLVEQARTIVARERDASLAGYSGQFKQYEGLVCNMMEFIFANGGALWDQARLRSAVDGPRAVEAVRFVRDRIIHGIAHRGVLAYEEPESLTLFVQGRAVFHRNWPYAWAVANDLSQSRIAGRVGMIPLPGFTPGSGAGALGGWHLAISRFSRNPDLAWRFVAFMTGEEIQRRIALSTGRAMTRKALYRDGELLRRMPQLESLREVFEGAIPRPATPVYAPLSSILQRYFSAVLARPEIDLRRRADFAGREMNRVLDLLRREPER
ncbi:MAG TPA: ABC transporter substrate-binding protein [candidate division Zixibacteria bacterium]|nr:ABC transporter substrate-binding protein [candidate division Zixibacteria bacterium]